MELWVRGTYISASSSPVLVSSEGIRVRPRLGEEASVTCSGREESGQNLVCMSQQLFNSPLSRLHGLRALPVRQTDLLDRLPTLRNFQTLFFVEFISELSH